MDIRLMMQARPILSIPKAAGSLNDLEGVLQAAEDLGHVLKEARVVGRREQFLDVSIGRSSSENIVRVANLIDIAELFSREDEFLRTAEALIRATVLQLIGARSHQPTLAYSIPTEKTRIGPTLTLFSGMPRIFARFFGLQPSLLLAGVEEAAEIGSISVHPVEVGFGVIPALQIRKALLQEGGAGASALLASITTANGYLPPTVQQSDTEIAMDHVFWPRQNTIEFKGQIRILEGTALTSALGEAS